ncbi:MAG: amidophosphoribosyltransferase, partial [Desulfuromonas sp.]
NLSYLGLYALQHSGQESCGIVASDGTHLKSHLGMGLVADVFKRDDVFSKLPGSAAIGHVRYSTAGGNDLKNCQPIMVDYSRGSIAVAHNGNLVNAVEIREKLEKSGSIFSTTADTETIIHLIARAKSDSLIDRVCESLKQVKGAYSLVFLTETRMIAVRDPNGFRPLSLGKLDGAFVVASESCAFDLIEAEYIREIEPGEMIVIDKSGMKTFFPFKSEARNTPCIFEYIYFARPDSRIFNRMVYPVRKEFGRELARRSPVDADLVMAVPDSGMPAAMGYAEEAGLPFELGLIRNHYVGRTFIEPQQSIRHFGVKLKLNPVREIIKDKRVIVVDDSIVRGTTSRKIVKMIRNAGAKEVHVRISSPPTSYPCFYGIDTPSRKELISASHTIDEIARYITADSLAYLELEGLHSALRKFDDDNIDFCDACFSGDYPVKFPRLNDSQLGLFDMQRP